MARRGAAGEVEDGIGAAIGQASSKQKILQSCGYVGEEDGVGADGDGGARPGVDDVEPGDGLAQSAQVDKVVIDPIHGTSRDATSAASWRGQSVGMAIPI